MKRASLAVIAACVLAVLFAEPSPHASAITGVPCYHPQKPCVAAFEYPGTHKPRLLITGPKRSYFRRYRLCVQAPDGSLSCDAFRIPRPGHHGYFISVITWSRHFPNEGPGWYSARWRRLPNHRLIGRQSFQVGH